MSNLLDKASILTTPTAYDNGRLLSVKPTPTLGSEGIVNGTFDTDSDWNKGSGWTIANGKATSNGTSSNSNLSQLGVYTGSELVKMTIDVIDYTSGTLQIFLSSAFFTEITANGSYIFYTIADRIDETIYLKSISFNGSVDNVSVKEVIGADFYFARGSSATRVNSQGLIENVTNNLPRIDYTDGVGSWLFEEQSTNLLSYSEDFTQWDEPPNTSGLITVESGYLAPDGSTNAYKITDNDPIGNSSFLWLRPFLQPNDARTIWAKTVSGTGTVNLCSNNANTNNLFTVTNEWQRFEVNSAPILEENFYPVDFRNSGTLNEVIVWGAQAERLSYATSYIPTNGSNSTRLQDVCNTSGNVDLINSTEGVLYGEIGEKQGQLRNRYIGINDGTLNNLVSINFTSGTTNSVRAEVKVNGVKPLSFTYIINDYTSFVKFAIKWKVNSFELWINGVKVANNTVGDTFAANTLNDISFDDGRGFDKFFGKTKSIAVFKEALTDEELTCLTTI